MNITLIGMPGSGKSYIGKELAKQLNYSYVGLDDIIEEEYKLSVPKILDKLGETNFLKKQQEDAIFYTAKKDKLIISPGGSIVYTEDAMKH